MKPISDKYRLFLLVISTIALLFASSCMKEQPDELPDKLVWNPELAFPLGEEQYGLNHVSAVETPPDQVSENGASIVTAYSRHDAIIKREGIRELGEAVSILFTLVLF